MDLYKEFPAHIVFMRRAFAVVAGVLALPVMLFWKDRARFYSYLHRVWAKTSEKPVGWIRPRKRPAIFTDTKTTPRKKRRGSDSPLSGFTGT